ncbi:hypothetical protein MOPEL_135_01130 [Mobilicoccus pelagius NBRC 104925]|uniref:Peptidase S26 domain-containing protein n=2 Tax=Mobilicoccus TaxID=984996 RepID=H5UVW7_9MICO|nr:hypothetical protein MOPEL_135_01130 [Mobilicoccus pelagius NBRC 104925]
MSSSTPHTRRLPGFSRRRRDRSKVAPAPRSARARIVTAARAVAATLAVVAVLVLGPPAMLGWVPLPVTTDLPGARAGDLVVVDPVETADVDTPERGDVVAVLTSTDRLALRTVESTSGPTLAVASAEGVVSTTPDRVRAVERYRLPVVGAAYGAGSPTQRMWWGRGLGAFAALWAGLEIWDGMRGSGRDERAPRRSRWRRWSGSRRDEGASSAPTPRGAPAPDATHLCATSRGAASGTTDTPSTAAATAPPHVGATPPTSRRGTPGAPAAARAVTPASPHRRLTAAYRLGSITSRADVHVSGGRGVSVGTSLPPLPLPPTPDTDDRERASIGSDLDIPGGHPQRRPGTDLDVPVVSVDLTSREFPTRRELARARRRRRPWDRVTEAAASAVGAVVLAARALDRRAEDPEDDAGGGGRHRSPLPARTIDAPDRADTAPRPALKAGPTRPRPDEAPLTGSPADLAAGPSTTTGDDRATSPTTPRSRAAMRRTRPPARAAGAASSTTPTGPTTETPHAAPRAARRGTPEDTSAVAGHTAGDTAPARADDTETRRLWRPRASAEEARRVALVQDFEARRAAAEAAFRHELARRELTSPAERLIAERERRAQAPRGTEPEAPTGDGHEDDPTA